MALAVSPTSGLMVRGDFSAVDGNVSAYIAKLAPTCPATAIASGGCPSSGGANHLEIESLPWAGATMRTHATGIPQTAIVLPILGPGTTSLPLSSVFPEGSAGCDVLVTPDDVHLMLGVGGVADFSLPLPNSTAITGVAVHHQMVLAELDSQGAIVDITATNALQLTVGAL